MSKLRMVLAVLAVVLVFGMFAGCSNDTDDPPVLTAFIPMTRDNVEASNWTPTTSFAVGDEINFGIRGTTRTHDVTRFVLTIKSGVTVYDVRDRAYNPPRPKEQPSRATYYGTFTPPPGSYTAEVYWEDAKGNKSNTMTTAFTVR